MTTASNAERKANSTAVTNASEPFTKPASPPNDLVRSGLVSTVTKSICVLTATSPLKPHLKAHLIC